MTEKVFDKITMGEGDHCIEIRLAAVKDIRRIQMLYAEVYGGSYSIPIVNDKEAMRNAIESDSYYWVVGDHGGRIVGSLVYAIDLEAGNSKAFGAVVSEEYRKLELAHTMMKSVLNNITSKRKMVDMVYATTRTTNPAPQKLTENLGFIKLGVFPNTHKVKDNETHCLTGYFTPRALEQRKKVPALIPEVVPFYDIVCKQIDLGESTTEEPNGIYSGNVKIIPVLEFENITAPEFIKRRYKETKHNSFFEHIVMPFHEPNLLLITPDQKTEVYVAVNKKDKYSAIMGGVTQESSFAVILESVARHLKDLGISYVEVVMEAYSPVLQREALDARFIPTAYFPCAKKVKDTRYDCIAFSRTFEILDFRNVKLISYYKNFLEEIFKLWYDNYIGSAFKQDK